MSGEDMERTGHEPPSIQLQSLQQALRGAVFPLSGEQLVWLARENEASSSVLSLLSQLPRASFGSVVAVQEALESQLGRDEEASR